RLRVQTNVALSLSRCARHVHVEVLEQLRHLRDEHVTATLLLYELERAREPAVRPSGEGGHPGGIAGITSRRTRAAWRSSRAARCACSTASTASASSTGSATSAGSSTARGLG